MLELELCDAAGQAIRRGDILDTRDGRQLVACQEPGGRLVGILLPVGDAPVDPAPLSLESEENRVAHALDQRTVKTDPVPEDDELRRRPEYREGQRAARSAVEAERNPYAIANVSRATGLALDTRCWRVLYERQFLAWNLGQADE